MIVNEVHDHGLEYVAAKVHFLFGNVPVVHFHCFRFAILSYHDKFSNNESTSHGIFTNY